MFVCLQRLLTALFSLNRASRSLAKTGFENGVPVSTGSSFSRNKVSNFGFVFGTVSGIVQGVLFEVFWAPFGHHFGAP